MHIRRLITIALPLFAFLNLSAQPPAQTIPDFHFFDMNNRSFTNQNLLPGKMLLFVFFDPGCEHCQHAMAKISKQYNAFRHIMLYLVSVADEKQIVAFINSYGSQLAEKKNVIVLRDARNEFISLFRPLRYPAVFLYSIEKKLVDYEDNEDSMFRIIQQIPKT